MAAFSLTTASAEETSRVGAALGALLRDGDVVTLVGELGAGKTQFSQGIGRGLGLACDISSPTFNIVFEYGDGRIMLYHFDLYRLEHADELEDIDFFALVDASTPGASLIEWADRFPDELPDDRLEVSLFYGEAKDDVGMVSAYETDRAARRISACATGPRSQELLSQWRGCLDAAS